MDGVFCGVPRKRSAATAHLSQHVCNRVCFAAAIRYWCSHCLYSKHEKCADRHITSNSRLGYCSTVLEPSQSEEQSKSGSVKCRTTWVSAASNHRWSVRVCTISPARRLCACLGMEYPTRRVGVVLMGHREEGWRKIPKCNTDMYRNATHCCLTSFGLQIEKHHAFIIFFLYFQIYVCITIHYMICYSHNIVLLHAIHQRMNDCIWIAIYVWMYIYCKRYHASLRVYFVWCSSCGFHIFLIYYTCINYSISIWVTYGIVWCDVAVLT